MPQTPIDMLQEFIGQENAPNPSAVGRWLNGILRKAERGSLSLEYTVREDMTNPAGILHGGIIATMIDDTIGATLVTLDGEFYTSINLVIDYFASVQIGEVVRTESKILKPGRTIMNVECVVYGPGDRVVARGTSNAFKIGQTIIPKE